jgi:hypothetical protein
LAVEHLLEELPQITGIQACTARYTLRGVQEEHPLLQQLLELDHKGQLELLIQVVLYFILLGAVAVLQQLIRPHQPQQVELLEGRELLVEAEEGQHRLSQLLSLLLLDTLVDLDLLVVEVGLQE